MVSTEGSSRIKVVAVFYEFQSAKRKKFKVGPATQRLGVLKKGLFGPALRVGQIGGKLYISYAKPS